MKVDFGLEELMQLVARHIEQRPAMHVQDVYKLLYQAIRGAEHNLPSPDLFTTRLQEELASLSPDPSEPLCESIRPDNALQRINLRAYLADSHDPDWLVEACLKTAKLKWGSQQDLIEVWQTFIYSVDAGYFPTISKDQACAFSIWLETHNFPSVHHSTIYQNTYRPDYRLVASQYLPLT